MDGEALVRDFGTHRGYLERIATQILESDEEAAEAVETTLRWVTEGHVAVEESAAAWLGTVIARTCRDMLRAREGRRRPVSLLETPAPEEAVADSIGVVLLAALERLSPQERLAFALHDVLGVPIDEIATIIGRSPGDTTRLLRRARRYLHRLDADDLPAYPPGDVPPADDTAQVRRERRPGRPGPA